MKIPCSVGILTLNSGKYIEDCLNSVSDFEDVFLLDGNSTDNTLDIARNLDVPVYKQIEGDEPNVIIQNFTEMREKALNLCKKDWFFFIDSDEFATPELIDEIREVLSKAKPDTIFLIQKKYTVKGKKIEHCFNYPNYYPRLFSHTHGVHFKKGKNVHEQVNIPPGYTTVKLKGAVYSAYPDTYSQCVKKDEYYLELARRNMFPGKVKRTSYYISLRNSVRYFLRAGNILYKTLKTYIKHGYKDSLPFLHAWRHVRYHLIISGYCIKQLFT